MQDRCKFDASLMQAEDTFTFTLDEETEKKLFDLLTDVDVSKTPSFSIKDKHGNEAEYVKVVRCKDCKHCQTYYHGENMPFSYACTMLMLTSIGSNDYCSKAERKQETI